MLELWKRLYAGRLDWAERAREEFLSSLGPGIRGHVSSGKGAVRVVLYGPTQVGKTTLLLTLLGIHETKQATVAEVLRGGQRAGLSATAMAMRYIRTASEDWSLRSGNQIELMNAAAMTSRLGQLRSQMECGELSATHLFEVGIPADLFGQDEPELHTEILDLPGIGAANPREREHVKAIAATHVLDADLVLLVGRADDLGFLKPGALELAELRYWHAMSHRFRVVLTFSTMADSFRDWVEKEGTLNEASIRRRIVSQMNTHGYAFDQPIDDIIYPVEYGDSWQGLKTRRPTLFVKMEPTITALLKALKEDIIRSASQEARISNAFRSKDIIIALMDKRQKEGEQEEIKINNDIIAANDQMSKNSRSISLIEGQIQSITEILKKIDDYMILLHNSLEFKFSFDFSALAVEDTRNGILKRISRREDEMIEIVSSIHLNKNESFGDDIVPQIISGYKKAISNIKITLGQATAHIARHTSDSYYPSLPWSDHSSDVNETRNQIIKAKKDLNNDLKNIAKITIDHRKKRQLDLSDAHLKLEFLKTNRENILKIISEESENLKIFRESLENDIKAGKLAINEADFFPNRLEEHFNIHINFEHKHTEISPPAERFIRLCFLAQQYERYRLLRTTQS